MITGDQLRQLRLIRIIKQETMAKTLGITQPAYCKLEQAEAINGERLEKILLILNYTQEEVEGLKKFLTP